MMQDDKKHELLISAIDYLKVQYAMGQSPCLALVISRHYRLLAESCAESSNKTNYVNQASSWFGRYLKKAKPLAEAEMHIYSGVYGT
jgi:hypothetical protein